jgi:hypothetical protein
MRVTKLRRRSKEGTSEASRCKRSDGGAHLTLTRELATLDISAADVVALDLSAVVTTKPFAAEMMLCEQIVQPLDTCNQQRNHEF